jgi:hypothetical protein
VLTVEAVKTHKWLTGQNVDVSKLGNRLHSGFGRDFKMVKTRGSLLSVHNI